jgi:hypothetical protein
MDGEKEGLEVTENEGPGQTSELIIRRGARDGPGAVDGHFELPFVGSRLGGWAFEFILR